MFPGQEQAVAVYVGHARFTCNTNKYHDFYMYNIRVWFH